MNDAGLIYPQIRLSLTAEFKRTEAQRVRIAYKFAPKASCLAVSGAMAFLPR